MDDAPKMAEVVMIEDRYDGGVLCLAGSTVAVRAELAAIWLGLGVAAMPPEPVAEPVQDPEPAVEPKPRRSASRTVEAAPETEVG